ncbi:MAG: deaminase [Candidatus Dojkabacteria bacterium]|nr:deaminase [Candidatus Dojkabacteria bacterium]
MDISISSDIYNSEKNIHISILEVISLWAKLRSKDPNTKVGAGVYDPITGGLFLGYNGFPSGFPDLKEIWDNRNKQSLHSKYHYVIHAEANAIRKALMALGSDIERCSLYVTHLPCHRCFIDWIIPSKISKIFYLQDYPDEIRSEIFKLYNNKISLIKI